VEKFCQHIEKLLAQHDYVVVPNLGGFVVQIQSAVLSTEYITPPLTTIGFNPLMHHADGLLAIEIARSEKISYRMAMEYIENKVESLKFNLQSGKKIQFGNLGTFYQNDRKNLLFSPEEKAGFLPQNFELTNLYISQKDRKNTNSSPKITITLPSRRVFRYASVAMLVFGLFCISPRMNDIRRMENADIVTSAFYNFSQQKEISKISIKADSTSVKSIAKDSDNYHVIVASLQKQETADNFCKELIADDFHSAHVIPTVKTYKVAIQSFSDKDKAISFMEKLRRTDRRFDTAWVLCK